MKELECSQDFSHYKSTGVFPDAQGQLTQQSLVRSGRISNSSEILWMSSLPASMKKIRSKTRTVRGSDYSPAIELSEQKDKLVTASGDTEKYSKKNKPTTLVKFCLLVLKILSRNKILTTIKSRNSVANLQNLTIYNPNLDIINVNVYTKFG